MRLMGDANADGLMDMIGIGDTDVYVGFRPERCRI